MSNAEEGKKIKNRTISIKSDRLLDKVRSEVVITGVMENLPGNSHLKGDCLISFASPDKRGRVNALPKSLTNGYLLFDSDIDKTSTEETINRILHRNKLNASKRTFFLQPLTAIHLDSNMVLNSASDIKYSIFLSALAFIIFVISITNYLNLAGARTLNQLKNIGIRHINGAGSSDIFIT